MQDKTERGVIETLLRATQEKRLWGGRLMSPDETAQAQSTGVTKDARVSGWFLCGTAHPSMFRCCATDTMHTLLFPLGTGHRLQFMVVVQQCRDWQSRMILPLVGSIVEEFLETLCRGDALQVSLADGDNDDAIVSQLTVGANSSLTELSAMRVQAEFDANEVVALMSSLIDALLKPELFRTIDSGFEVRHVCVSYIFPSDLRERVERDGPSYLIETESPGTGSIH